MKHARTVVAIVALALSAGAYAQSAPAAQPGVVATKLPPAALPAPTATLLTDAEAKAKAEGKNVLVIFHASWCGWCKRLDAFMTDPKFQPVFDQNFETVKVTVLESDDKKIDENPGGLDEMDQLGGKDAGLPLFAILDPDGKMIINSMMPDAKDPKNAKGVNTGFPSEANEIDHFLEMMQKGAPKITPDQIADMKAYLTAKHEELKSGGH